MAQIFAIHKASQCENGSEAKPSDFRKTILRERLDENRMAAVYEPASARENING